MWAPMSRFDAYNYAYDMRDEVYDNPHVWGANDGALQRWFEELGGVINDGGSSTDVKDWTAFGRLMLATFENLREERLAATDHPEHPYEVRVFPITKRPWAARVRRRLPSRTNASTD